MLWGLSVERHVKKLNRICIVLAVAIWTIACMAVTAESRELTLINIVDTTVHGSSDPSGITFFPDTETLLQCDSEAEETPYFIGFNLFELGLSGNLLGSYTTLGFTTEPTGITLNTVTNTIFITDDVTQKVFEVDPVDLENALSSFSTSAYSNDPEGIAFNTSTGNLYIAEGLNHTVYEVTTSGLLVTTISLPSEIIDPEGIYYDDFSGHLFIVWGKKLFEISVSGVMIDSTDLVPFGVVVAKGITFAPSSDPNDDPFIENIYIVDYGIDEVNDGRLFEFSFNRDLSNNPPQIDSGPTSVPNPVFDNETAQLSVQASDVDGDDLTYFWSPEDGSITGAGSTVTYIPPNVVQQQIFTITVTVYDGRGGSDAGTVDVTVIPHPRPLNVLRAGTGTGTVTSSPPGIDCGMDCTEDFSYGSTVTLTATPDTGSVFAGWSGDPDCSDGMVTINAATTCTATFDLYSLSIVKAGTGTGTVTSSLPGIDCGIDCSENYPVNTVVTLVATPDTGSDFIGWGGDPDCLDGEVTTNGTKTCIATFDLEIHTLTVTKGSTGSGTVTSAPAGIDCGADCSEDYTYGTEITLTATPDIGTYFTGWGGDIDCADGMVTINAATTCTAVFDLEMYPFSITKAGMGSGTVTSAPVGIDCGADCSEDYPYGTVINLTATPDDGSLFAGWSGDPDCSDGIVSMDVTGTGTEVNVLPIADAYVLSTNPSSNYGDALDLKVDGSPTKTSYLRFDVTGLSTAVLSARLRAEVLNSSVSGGYYYLQ
jgi:hypothetical protein